MNLFLANGPPKYQSRDALNTSTQTLADEPTLAKGPPWVPEQRWLGRWTFFCQWPHPSTKAEETCMPLHKTWQMNLLWPMDPPVSEQRCLECQYTKLGRWTYFGQWTPQYQGRDALHTSTQNLADEPTLADAPPSTRAQMPCIPVHKTWQMNLLWPMDPPVWGQRCLACHYTKLCRWTYFGQWPPVPEQMMPWIPLHKTWQMNLLWPMDPTSTRAEMSWIPVHKTWQMNLLWPMDPTSTRAEMPWIPVHKTWQMNLLWPMDPPVPEAEMPWIPVHKTWQMTLLWLMHPPVPEHRCLEYQYTKLGRWTYFGQWTPQSNKAEMPSHCYWHLVVKHGNCTLLLTSSGQAWDFHIATDI